MKFTELCKRLNLITEADADLFPDYADETPITPDVDDSIASPSDSDFDINGIPSPSTAALGGLVEAAKQALEDLKKELQKLGALTAFAKEAESAKKDVKRIELIMTSLNSTVQELLAKK